MTMSLWYPSTSEDTWSTIANRFGRASEIVRLRELNGGSSSPGESDIVLPPDWYVYGTLRYFVEVPTSRIFPVVKSPVVPDGVIQQSPERDAVGPIARVSFAPASSNGIGSVVYDFLYDSGENSKNKNYSGERYVHRDKMVAMVRPPVRAQTPNIVQFVLQHYRNRHFRAWHIKRLRGGQSYDEHGARAKMTADCPPLWWPVVPAASYSQVRVAPSRKPQPVKQAQPAPSAPKPPPPKPPVRETDPRFDSDILQPEIGFQYVPVPSGSGALSIIPWANSTPSVEESRTLNTIASHPKLLAWMRELTGISRRANFIEWMNTVGQKVQKDRVQGFLCRIGVLVKCMDAAYKFTGSKEGWDQVAKVRQALTKLTLAIEERVDVTEAMEYAPDAIKDYNKAGAVIVERINDPNTLKAFTDMTDDNSIPLELRRSAVQVTELTFAHSLDRARATVGAYRERVANNPDIVVGFGSVITKWIGNQWGPSSLFFWNLNKKLSEELIKATATMREQVKLGNLSVELTTIESAIAALDKKGPAPIVRTPEFEKAEQAFVNKLMAEQDRADRTGTPFNSRDIGPPPARELHKQRLDEFAKQRKGLEFERTDVARRLKDLGEPKNVARELLKSAKEMGWKPGCTEAELAHALDRAARAQNNSGRLLEQTKITEMLTKGVEGQGVVGHARGVSISAFGNGVLTVVNMIVLAAEFRRDVSKELETLTGVMAEVRSFRRYVDKWAAAAALANSGIAVTSSLEWWIFSANRAAQVVETRALLAAGCTGAMGVFAALQGIVAGVDDVLDACDMWHKPGKMFDSSFKMVSGIASIGVGVVMGVATYGWWVGSAKLTALGPPGVVAGFVLAVGQLLKSFYDVATAEPGQFSPFTMGVRQLAKELQEMRMLDAGRAPKALGVEAEVNELVAVLNKAVFSFPFWDKHGEVDHEFIARLRSYLQRGEQEPVLMSQVALPEDFVMQLVRTPKPLFTPRR